MKKLLLLILFIPALTFSQSRKEIKSKAASDKITFANAEAHIKYLADDKLEGRRAGTRGEQLAMEYIITQFKKDGLAPKGTNGFVQEFEINEGKQFTENENKFLVNDRPLELKKDYYPLAFSENATVSGSASLSLREEGEPWFWDVKDVLDESKDNPHFDVNLAIKQQAAHAEKENGKALFVFNSSTSTDNILFDKNDTTAIFHIPVVYITKDGLQKYFPNATDIYNIELHVSLAPKKTIANNIIGYLNFNAPQTIIIGAHYDHLGFGDDGNSLDGAGQIHNGADDNASGTAALIELGRLLQKTKARNSNYLFIAFSGEELGLLGSKYWLQHPSLNIVPNYMINMDMVGRYDSSRKLTIGGYGTSPVWGPVFATTTDKNLVIKFDSSGSGPSDHASFYRNDIPVLFFFTNSHSDYHKASDDWDKINFRGETEIIDYIIKVINAANDKGKLLFTKTRDQEMRSISLPVTLGIMPDYGFTGTGVRIEVVSKGKTAEHTGLQAGDVLLQLGEYKFVDMQTYMGALQKFKKGDKTQVHFKRSDKEMMLDVQF